MEEKCNLKKVAMNSVSLTLHKLIPLSWQHKFRDSGGIQAILDLGAVFLASIIMIRNPSFISKFLELGKLIKVYQYGETDRHIIQVFKVHPSNSSSDFVPYFNRATIFVHGGAWGSGQLWMYRLIAYNYAKLLRSEYFILVGYPVYPNATVLEQKECIKNTR